MTMNVNLTPELEALVRGKVESGHYSSASEVVREALRLMDERDQMQAAKLEQLRRDVRAGAASGSAGELSATEIKKRGRMRLAQHKTR